jgi:squalene-associated FAD-dependent desaturase
VIGGGWAGCAAAASLAAEGVQVTLYEAASELGGRGRRVVIELDGVEHALDNGQHLLIGAYTAIAGLLTLVGVDLDVALQRRPFEIGYPDGVRLRASRLPAPWHLATALIGARGLTWRDRAAMARLLRTLRASGWHVGRDRPAGGWLADHGQSARLVRRVWRPLALAALNTALDEASAQIFANVLRDSLGAGRDASTLWLPRTDLSTLLPDAIARFIEERGGTVQRGVRIERVETDADGFRLEARDAAAPQAVVDAVVYAAPPAALARVAAPLASRLGAALALVERFAYEPICTVYLKYDTGVTVPRGFLALLDEPARGAYGQWVFDRGALDGAQRGVLAVIISGSGAHLDVPQGALADAVAAQLSAALRVPAPRAARVIIEKRATLAARPDLQRPAGVTNVPGFVLAGDWTANDYPSTLESAVRSGIAAARHLLG